MRRAHPYFRNGKATAIAQSPSIRMRRGRLDTSACTSGSSGSSLSGNGLRVCLCHDLCSPLTMQQKDVLALQGNMLAQHRVEQYPWQNLCYKKWNIGQVIHWRQEHSGTSKRICGRKLLSSKSFSLPTRFERYLAVVRLASLASNVREMKLLHDRRSHCTMPTG